VENYPDKGWQINLRNDTDISKIDNAKTFIREYLTTKPEGDLRKNIVKAGAKDFSTNQMHRALDQLKNEGSITIETAPGMAGNHKWVKLVIT
jgi:hypothetical protein